MLVDANLLLYAVDETTSHHASSKAWLAAQLNGPRRVGLPWQSLGAFLRIVTHPRASERPLTASEAWAHVEEWLAPSVSWSPSPGERYVEILRELVVGHDVRGNLVSDAKLVALALEHGLTICSADSDFARFSAVRWTNPLAP